MATKRKSAIQNMADFSPSFDSVTGRYTWMVDYDESITDKLRAIMHETNITDEHFPDERSGKLIVSGHIWHPKIDLRQREVEEKAEGILARPKEIIDFGKTFPRPTLGRWVDLAAPGQLWETKGGPFDLSRDHRAVVLKDDSNWRSFGTHSAILNTTLNWDKPCWSDYWSFLVLDGKVSPKKRELVEVITVGGYRSGPGV